MKKNGILFLPQHNKMSGTGDTPSGIAKLPIIVPQSLKFPSLSRNPNVTRREKVLRPRDNMNSSNGNNIIHFDLPAETMDLRTGFLLATLTITKTGGTYARLAQGSWCWIDYLRVCAGGGYDDRIQYYGRWYSMLWNTTISHDVQSTIGQDLLGLGSQATRNAYGADTNGTQYVIPVRCGILNQGFLPLKNLCTPTNGQSIFVEFVIDNPSNFIETDGTNPQITISNCRWSYEQLSGDVDRFTGRDIFESAIAMEVATGLVLGYKHWSVYQQPVINSSNDIPINSKVSSLNAILTTIVDGSNLNNPAVNDKYTTWPKILSNGATYTTFQWQINNTWIPFEPVDCTGDAIRAYMHLLKFQGVWESKGIMVFAGPVTLESFNDDQFVIVGDFYSAGRNIWRLQEEEYQFNDLNIFTSQTYPLLRVEMSAPPPAQTIAYNYVHHNVIVTVDSKGLLTKRQ